MNPVVQSELKEVMEAVPYRPAVSIIIPFDPKMRPKGVIMHSLKLAVDKVKRELEANYPNDLGKLVMQKLEASIKNLNFNTYKNSVAIYLSPLFEKVLYLDILVEEKIIIDESFEIRDLVYSKKHQHKYLVLLLSGTESKIFLGNSEDFVRIISNTPESVSAYINDVPERVANFSDISKRKEVITDKFLHYMDNVLDSLLKSYHMPLFVLGTDKILGHFKSITHHTAAIVDYIPGNYLESTIPELRAVLAPHISDWKKIIESDLLNKLEEAADKKKLVSGMRDVWREAVNHKGKLLVVEKNYMYAAEHDSHPDTIHPILEPYNRFSYIKDAVDDVIEKVLENGGDVEFVDEGLLNRYHQIALVRYY